MAKASVADSARRKKATETPWFLIQKDESRLSLPGAQP